MKTLKLRLPTDHLTLKLKILKRRTLKTTYNPGQKIMKQKENLRQYNFIAILLDLNYSCVPIIITFSLFTGEVESAKLQFISSKQYLLHVGTSTLIDHKRSQKLTTRNRFVLEVKNLRKVHMVALVMWFMALVDYHT